MALTRQRKQRFTSVRVIIQLVLVASLTLDCSGGELPEGQARNEASSPAWHQNSVLQPAGAPIERLTEFDVDLHWSISADRRHRQDKASDEELWSGRSAVRWPAAVLDMAEEGLAWLTSSHTLREQGPGNNAQLSRIQRSLLQAPGAAVPSPGGTAEAPKAEIAPTPRPLQGISDFAPQPDAGVLSIEAVIDMYGVNLLPFGQQMQQVLLDVLNQTIPDVDDDSFQLLSVDELLPLSGPASVTVNNTGSQAPLAGRRRLLQALASTGDSNGIATLPHVEVRVRILVTPNTVQLVRNEIIASINGPVLSPLNQEGLDVQYIQLSSLNLNYGSGASSPLPAVSSKDSLSRVAVGLIAAGCTVFVAVVALTGFIIHWYRRRKERLSRQSSDLEKAPPSSAADVHADTNVPNGHLFLQHGLPGNGLGMLVGSGGSHHSSLAGSLSSHRSSAGRSQAEETDVLRLDTDVAFDARAWTVPFTELHFSRVIGQGSFGKVFLGKWRETAVAIKLLSQPGGPLPDDSWDLVDLTRLKDASWSDSQQARSRAQAVLQEQLQKEAGLMCGLRHPNIVMFLGVALEPPCMVTEFCARGSLLDVLHRARHNTAVAAELDWRRRLKLALDAAKGMFYLHSRQPSVLHRDLKSANLLVDKHWQVKVADFNLSRVMQPSAEVSSLAATNPRWLPPEVLGGQPYTCAADCYSFGIILWELLTWRVPWEDSTPWQVVISVVDHQQRPDIPIPAELPGGLPAAYEMYLKVMQQCWASEPATRPTYEAIIGQVRELIDEEDDASRRQLQTPPAIARADSVIAKS